MTNQAFEVIEKVKKVTTYRQILNKPINGLLTFIEFGPIYRSFLENGRRFAHIRWIPVISDRQVFACVHCRGHNFDMIYLKLCQNVNLYGI